MGIIIRQIIKHIQISRVVFTTLLLAGLSSCATVTTSKVATDASLARLQSCEQFYQAQSEQVKLEKVKDVQTVEVAGFPFLSVDRFLVSFQHELDSQEKQDFWIAEAAKLNLQARMIEWRNLSDAARKQIQQRHLNNWDFKQRITACSDELLRQLSNDAKQQIIFTAKVNDSYATSMRVFGLYPVTSLVVSRQIKKHQQAKQEVFATPLSGLPVKGQLQRYVPNTSPMHFENPITQNNPLGIPPVTSPVLNELFIRYAPVLEIDETGEFDKVGKIALDTHGKPHVDVNSPTVYYLPSYTRFNNKVLLQLNYVFWFSERPRQSRFDLYGGLLDGIIWRVTLDENLQPFIFDSVHNCGCYHEFYITNKVKAHSEIINSEREPLMVVQNNMSASAEVPWVLRIDSSQHFINRVYQRKLFDEEARDYHFESYHQLRSLPFEKGFRSLFAEDGLVTESARLERWILWPMGVPSAGAMRQWGHHAVAFVGRRHFDDAYLLDRYFGTVSGID